MWGINGRRGPWYHERLIKRNGRAERQVWVGGWVGAHPHRSRRRGWDRGLLGRKFVKRITFEM